jgi:hypothetical protein
MTRLRSVYLGWTGVLALAVLVVAVAWPHWLRFAVVAACLVDGLVLVACLRSWWAGAEYRWFWWTR